MVLLTEDLEHLTNEVILFLEEYRWVYDFKWTEISIVQPWLKAPKSWMPFLINLSFDDLKTLLSNDFSDIPSDLNYFLKFHQRLSAAYDVFPINPYPISRDVQLFKHIKPKKCHEVYNITMLVKSLSDDIFKEACLKIVDFGSGIGHLASVLCKQLQSAKVLAVEGNKYFHQRSRHDPNVQQLNFFVTEDSLNEFHHAVETYLSNSNIITGLHCCGSFSSYILKYFVELSPSKLLILFPCCYHRMVKDFVMNGFPLSHFYNERMLLGELQFVSPYFLRLGCQESKETWLTWTLDDYFIHQYNVGFRAAIELAVADHKGDFGKLKRQKIRREKIATISFDDFVQSTLLALGVPSVDILMDYVKDQIPNLRYYSIMLMLQMAIQTVVEFFLFMDRVLYLRQDPNILKAHLVRVFDPLLSPRNIAIVAQKL